MIHECVDQYACLAANISFNLEGLRNGFWQLTIDGLSWGSIYALVAVGYTLVFGVLRLINFAHSEIFMLGMFGALFGLDFILGRLDRVLVLTAAVERLHGQLANALQARGGLVEGAFRRVDQADGILGLGDRAVEAADLTALAFADGESGRVVRCAIDAQT